MQLLSGLAPSTLLATEERIQVLGGIQGGRKQLEREELSLHIKVGMLKKKKEKEKSGKGQFGRQEKSSTKSAALRSKPGCE